MSGSTISTWRWPPCHRYVRVSATRWDPGASVMHHCPLVDRPGLAAPTLRPRPRQPVLARRPRPRSRCPCAVGRLLHLLFGQGWVCIALALRYIRTPGQTFAKPLWPLVGGENLGRPGRGPTRAHSPAHSRRVTVTGALGVEHLTQCEVKCCPPISPQSITSAPDVQARRLLTAAGHLTRQLEERP